MRALSLLFISAMTGLILTRCASSQLTAEQTEQIRENQSAKETVNNSKMTPAEKKQVGTALDNSTKQIKKDAVVIAKQDAEIQRLAWYEDIFWQAVLVFGSVAVGAGLVFWFKR